MCVLGTCTSRTTVHGRHGWKNIIPLKNAENKIKIINYFVKIKKMKSTEFVDKKQKKMFSR